MIDLHTHIIPGLDDGSKDMKESLAMAKIAYNEGIKTLVATPHVLPGVYDNEKGRILTATAELNSTLIDKGIAINILPGAEYYLEPYLLQLLSRGELLTLNNNGRYLLIELPSDFIPEYTSELLYQIQLQGVTPIIAHPERNAGFIKRPEKLRELTSRGMLAQVTSGSITGWFGRKVKQSATSFLRQGLVQMLGSDAHSAKGRAPLLREACRMTEKILGPETTRRLVWQNPYRIINGETLEAHLVPSSPPKETKWRLFRL